MRLWWRSWDSFVPVISNMWFNVDQSFRLLFQQFDQISPALPIALHCDVKPAQWQCRLRFAWYTATPTRRSTLAGSRSFGISVQFDFECSVVRRFFGVLRTFNSTHRQQGFNVTLPQSPIPIHVLQQIKNTCNTTSASVHCAGRTSKLTQSIQSFGNNVEREHTFASRSCYRL